MPHEIQITKYCCNVCGYPYENYNTAIMCENAVMIPEHEAHKCGEVINFDAEDGISSMRTSSTFENGLILAKAYLTTKNQAGFFEHHVGYIVKCREDGDDWEERIVLWADDGFGSKKLYSPDEFRYKKNFHKNLPKNLKIIEFITEEQYQATHESGSTQ